MLQLWTCCLLCVCSLRFSDFVHHSKSLSIRIGGFPLWNPSPISGLQGRAGAAKLHFLSDLSCAAGTLYRAFSPSIYKISYRTVLSISCTLWLQKFLSAEILLTVYLDHFLEDRPKIPIGATSKWAQLQPTWRLSSKSPIFVNLSGEPAFKGQTFL